MAELIARGSLALLVLAAAVAGCGDDGGDARQYSARLDELNGSGVDGRAELRLTGDHLEVDITASGLDGGRVHEQSLHHPREGAARCPEDRGRSLLDGEEARSSYGRPVVELEPYPTLGDDGELDYHNTLTLDSDELGDLGDATLVLFGLTRDGRYLPEAPVACGELTR